MGTEDLKISTGLGVLSDPNGAWDKREPLPSVLNSTSSPVSEEQAKSFLEQINSPSSSNPPEQNPLQLINLAALDIWKSYIEEGEKSDNDAAKGYWNQFKEAIETSFNGRGKTERDDSTRGWANERALVSEVEKILKEGTALTIHSALYLIEKGMVPLPEKGAAHIRERARAYLGYDEHSDPGLITRLIRYTNEASPDSVHAKALLDETFSNLESKDSAVQTAFAIYSLVNQLSPEAEIQQETQGHLNALQGHSSFKRAAEKFLYSLSPTEVAVNVGLFFVAGGLGNLAKLLAMKKFEQAGVIGLKAIAGATGTGFAVETASLGTFNNLQQVLTHDSSKMTAKDIANNYKKAASMILFTKFFGNIGAFAAPNFAKGLGLATKEGLTLGGKALSWGVGHTAGLSGMVASSRFNQMQGWQQAPIGGENESLMNDFLSYAEFSAAQGLAHSAVDALTQGKLSAFQQRQQQEITERGAKLISQIPARLSPAMAAMTTGATILLAPELAHAAIRVGEASSEGGANGLLSGLAALTLGGLAMAARRSGKGKIPAAQIKKIKMQIIEKIGGQEAAMLQFLGVFDTLVPPGIKKEIKIALEALDIAIKALDKTDFTAQQKYQLLTLILEKAGRNVRVAFEQTPRALEAMEGEKFSSKEKYQFLADLASRIRIMGMASGPKEKRMGKVELPISTWSDISAFLGLVEKTNVPILRQYDLSYEEFEQALIQVDAAKLGKISDIPDVIGVLLKLDEIGNKSVGEVLRKEVDSLAEQIRHAQATGKDFSSPATYLFVIAEKCRNEDVRNYAKSRSDEFTVEWTKYINILINGNTSFNKSEIFASIGEAANTNDHFKVAELIPLFFSKSSNPLESSKVTLYSPNSLIRMTTVNFFLSYLSKMDLASSLWSAQKPLIEKDLSTPHGNTSWNAMKELQQFAEFGIKEALLRLVEISRDSTDPDKQEDAVILLDLLQPEDHS